MAANKINYLLIGYMIFFGISACAEKESPENATIANVAADKGSERSEILSRSSVLPGDPARINGERLLKSTASVVGSSGLIAPRAYEFLKAEDFDRKVNNLAIEGRATPGASVAAFELEQTLGDLAVAVDPQAQLGPVACNGDVCVASLDSHMDSAQWEEWKAEFGKSKGPARSATIYSTARNGDGSVNYRIMLVTKPNTHGVSIPFREIPVNSKQKS